MAHAFQQFLRRELDSRGWKQADLARESKLSRALVSKYVSDSRDRLVRPPEEATVAGFAQGLKVEPRVIWVSVAEAMGLPAEAMPTIVHELRDSTDQELLSELQRRLEQRVVDDAAWAAQVQREEEVDILVSLGRNEEPEFNLSSENPYPADTIMARRFDTAQATARETFDLMVSAVSATLDKMPGRPVDVVWSENGAMKIQFDTSQSDGGGSESDAHIGTPVAAREGVGDLDPAWSPEVDVPPEDDE